MKARFGTVTELDAGQDAGSSARSFQAPDEVTAVVGYPRRHGGAVTVEGKWGFFPILPGLVCDRRPQVRPPLFTNFRSVCTAITQAPSKLSTRQRRQT
jgi:hypothetical protein